MSEAPARAFAPDEIAEVISSDWFKKLDPEKRAAFTNGALSGLHDNLSQQGEWTPARQKQWGKFASYVQDDTAPSTWEKTVAAVKAVPGMISGLAKDVVVAHKSLKDYLNQGDDSDPEEVNKGELASAFGKAEGGNTLDWLGWIGEGLAGGDIGGGHSNEDFAKKQAALKGFRESIDNGDVPIGDRDKLKAWMDEHAKELPALNNPDNAPLLANYLKTRNPAAWSQLSGNLTRNAMQTAGKDMVKEALESTGAEQLPEGLREHLASASDPVNQLMMLAPFLHGAEAVKAATTASKLAQIGESAAEQTAFGAAQHSRDNPNASASELLEAGLEQGVTGAVLTGAHTVLGAGAKALAKKLPDLAKPRAQGRTVFADGQTYYQDPEGNWSHVTNPDSSGNMFIPLDPQNAEHASAIDTLNQKAAEQAPNLEPEPEAPAPEETPAEAPPAEETPIIEGDPAMEEAPAAAPAEPENPAAAPGITLDEAPPEEEAPPAAPADESAAVTLPADPNLPEQPANENAVPQNEAPPQNGNDAQTPPADAAPAGEPANEPAAETTAAPQPNQPESPPVTATGKGTSTKNAVMEAERANRGESPIEQQAAREWGEAWNDAVAAVAEDSTAGQKLVDSIHDNPRALNDKENALLLHEKIQKRKLVRNLVDQINNAPEGTRGDVQARLSVALEELNRIDNATKQAGTETGRGLNARKMMRDEDNNLETMLATYRAAKGADLTEGELHHVIDIHKDLTDAAKAIDEHGEAQANKAAQDTIRQMQEELRQEMAGKVEAARARLKAREERAKKPKPLKYRDNLPDRSDNVDWDTVDFVRSEGGLNRPPPLKRNAMGVVENARGEHNALRQFAKDRPGDYGNLTSENGLDIDKAASHAHEDNLIDEPTPDAFMAKLREDIEARRRGREDARAQDKAMADEERAAMREGRQFEGEQRSSERVQSDAGVPLSDQAKNFFQEARRKARARLDEDASHLHADPLGFQFFRSSLDHVIIGASHLAEGVIDKAAWAARMVGEFGEAIKPHLDSLYEKSKSMFDSTRKDFQDRAEARARAATPQGVMDTTIDRMSSGKMDAVNFDPKFAKELVKAYVARGVTDVHELNAKVHADVIKIFPEMTSAEVRRAWSDYGKVTKPSQDALKKSMREMKAQAKLVESYERASRGEPPLKGGHQPDQPSPTVRKMREMVKDMMRKMGIETEGPEQLKNARDGVVSRLKNQIDDLHKEMEGKAKPRDAREQIQYDDEMNALKKERDELRAYMDDLTGPSKEGKWNQQAERAAHASAENYRRRIAQGKLENPAGSKYEPNEKTKAAIAERDAAKAEWDRLRESSGIPQREALAQMKAGLIKRIAELQERIAGKAAPEKGKPVALDTEAQMLKYERNRLQGILNEMEKGEKRGMTDTQRAEAMTKRTEKAIADIEKELATGKRPAKNRSEFVPDAKLRALQAELKSLRDIRDAAREAQIPRRSPDEIALESLKKRIKTNTEKLDERLRNGDFNKSPRKKIELDREGHDLQAAYERKRFEFDRAVEAQRLANRPEWRKVTDALVRWRRGFLLSGYHTLEKLGGAAALRLVLTPAEEAIGGVLSKLPLISRFADAAPREGGISLRAEARALTDGVVDAIKESGDILKTGKSSLDVRFGKNHMEDLNPSVIDIFGHIHAMIKAPAKMAEFARSFQKRAEFAMRQGLDPHNPVIQTQIMKDAYLDANRAIFMQDNILASGFETAMRRWESSTAHPIAGPAFAALFRTLLPIVKVPTNVAFETGGSYVAGLPRAAAEMAYLLHRGLDTMKPAEADAVMRHLKKGSLGSAMILFGFFHPSLVGGYRQENEKRKPGDVPAGDLKVGDVTVSHHLLHTPALNAMQLGATISRVGDEMVRAHGRSTGETKGMSKGLQAAAFGLLKDVPFVGDTVDVFHTGHEGDYQRQRLVQGIVPLGIKQAAEDLDPVRRKVSGYGDAIKEAIPGLRETLPPTKKQPVH